MNLKEITSEGTPAQTDDSELITNVSFDPFLYCHDFVINELQLIYISFFLVFVTCFQQLMGLELCQSGDDECFKRRIIAEAHLDYIYTQHRKP